MAVKRRRTWKQRLLRATLVLMVIWAVACGLAAWKLTRRLRSAYDEPAPRIDGVTVENHRLSTADGHDIGAWYIPGRPGRGTVLVLHGYASSRSRMRRLVTALAEDGLGVMAITFRAHGDSSGQVNDIGYSARHDVVAAVEFLERRRPGGRVVVCGTSQGAAAAIFAAGELGTRVHGYLLDCPYRDLETAVWKRVSGRLPPVLDYAVYAGLRLWAPAFMPVPVERVDPCARIGDIPDSVPVVIAAGEFDRYVGMDEIEALLEPVKSHGQVVVFPRARHSRLFRADPVRYRQVLGQLLAPAAPPAQARLAS